MTDDEDQQGVVRLANAGMQLPAMALGAVVGALGGDPTGAVVGALTGSVLGSVGNEIASRLLSHQEEKRVGAVLISAAAAITSKQTLHDAKVRDDGFFAGEGSSGAEFVEGVLLAARDTFEQRKIPYMGNLIANVALAKNIDGAAANRALTIADNLSWTEMCVVAIFLNQDKYPMPERPVGRPNDWDNWAVLRALQDVMPMTSRAMMMHPFGAKEEDWGIPKYDTNLSAIKITDTGNFIGGLMELEDIPDPDLQPLYDTILAAKEPPPKTTG